MIYIVISSNELSRRPLLARTILWMSILRMSVLQMGVVLLAVSMSASAFAQTTLPTTAPGAPKLSTPRDGLLAHATNESYWIARVVRERRNDANSPERTLIFVRTLGEVQWKQIGNLRGRAVSLADYRGQLVVLMTDGQWLAIWSDGSSLGTPPPAGIQLKAIANSPDGLIAIATGGTPPATQPAATQPTPSGLYRFEDGNWVFRQEIPVPAESFGGEHARLAARGPEIIALAPRLTREGVDAFRLRGGNAVERVDPAAIEFPPGQSGSTDLFVAGNRIAIAAISRTGSSRVVSLTDSVPPLDLPAPAGVGAFESAAMTFAAENYRLVVASGETIAEQSFRPDGTPAGQLTKLTFGPQGEQVSHWNQFIVMFGIAIMLFAVSRRRGGVIELPSQLGVRLAPIFPRLAAGTVDALPILVTAGVLSYQVDFHRTLGSDLQALTVQQAWWMSLATAFYLLHTSVSELFTGRTLGKWIFKLWVVSIDAQPARPGQIVTRNLLRFLDVSMAGFPLLLLFASPLRQRVGDLAAGTMVVAKGTAEPVEETDPGLTTSIDLESDEKRKSDKT